MNVRPLRDGIYVKKLPAAKLSELIVIPDVAQPESTRWEVLAVGPGKRGKKGQIIPCDVRVGDVVVLGPYKDYEDGEFAFFTQGDIRYIEQPDVNFARGYFDEYIEPAPHSL